MESNADILKCVPLFSSLDEFALEALARRCRRRRFRANDTLFHKGEPGHTLYVIVEGSVKIQNATPTGEIVHLAMRKAGEPFGEMSLIDGKPRMADAVTAEESDILMLDREDFVRCIRRAPEIALGVMGCLADRLREAANQRESHQGLSPVGRVAEILLDLAQSHGHLERGGAIRICARVSQQELAERTGTVRETVNRAFGYLRSAGAIRMDGRTVIVMDRQKLRQFSLR